MPVVSINTRFTFDVWIVQHYPHSIACSSELHNYVRDVSTLVVSSRKWKLCSSLHLYVQVPCYGGRVEPRRLKRAYPSDPLLVHGMM